MSKKTVYVSEQLITSILVGYVIVLLTLIIGHAFTKNWTALPKYSTGDGPTILPHITPVCCCSYECLFGKTHQNDCTGKNIGNFHETKLTLGEIFSASFEHDNSKILIFGLLLSLFIYIIRRFRFKIYEE
jgi:hypothetical protein